MQTRTYILSLFRMVATSLALAIVISILVLLFGVIAGWRTALQFSNGLFIGGSIVIIFGILMVWGGFTSRASFQTTYAQSISDMSLAERSKLWVLDSLRGYNAVAAASICGVVMFGFSVLIYELFG